MRSAYRTPSPEKAASEANRKHSPWTAQRARKKGKSSPDAKPGLPDVDENDMEDVELMGGRTRQISPSQSAIDRALHLAQNPFLDLAQMPLSFSSAIGIQGLASLAGRTTHRSLVLQPSQAILDRQQSAPVFCPTWQLQPPAMAISTSLLQPCQEPIALCPGQPLHVQHQPRFATTNGSAPQLGLDALCTSALECNGRVSKENAPPDLCMASGVHRGGGQLVGSAFGGGSTVRLGLGLLPSFSTGMLDGSSTIVELRKDTDAVETSRGGPLITTCRLSQPHTSCVTAKTQEWGSPAHGSSPQSVYGNDATGASNMQCDLQHRQEPATTPRLTPSQPSSVAPTPSPKVLAPGIRLDGHGKVPPRVPSSCRTIRRVLVDSPDSSTGWRTRPNSGMSGDAQMQAPDVARAALRFGDQDGEAMPMSVEKLLHEPKRRLGVLAVFETVEEDEAVEEEELRTGSTLTWFRVTPPAERLPEMGSDCMDLQEGQVSNRSGGISPGFVLNRGIITPEHLLPETDDEDPGPVLRGPLKGLSCHSISRSGELSTFDERLHQAVQNGDAMTVGQAWQDVKSGTVKADDIDTLNTLLKCFCKMDGDPNDADEIVKEVCKDGRVTPNASTYHHLAAIWTRHEQLNNVE